MFGWDRVESVTAGHIRWWMIRTTRLLHQPRTNGKPFFSSPEQLTPQLCCHPVLMLLAPAGGSTPVRKRTAFQFWPLPGRMDTGRGRREAGRGVCLLVEVLPFLPSESRKWEAPRNELKACVWAPFPYTYLESNEQTRKTGVPGLGPWVTTLSQHGLREMSHCSGTYVWLE